MLKLFIILCFAFIGSNCLSKYEDEWINFKVNFGKEYRTTAEENYRKAIFISNAQKVEEHNKLYEQGLKTYSMKINQFADLHNKEFNRIYNGLKISKTSDSLIDQIPFIPPKDDIPDSIDWRDLGAVTEVKDQGSCGSCWAFSSTGALEGQLFRKTGNLISISEQNLVDCSKDGNNNGCNGGYMVPAFQYVIDNNGIDSEEGYPYEGYDNDCRYSVDYNVTTATGIVVIEKGNEDDLKTAVATAGPVAVAIDASHLGFSMYFDGVYYEEDCMQGLDDIDELDHGVLVVGYGTEDGEDYWLVKNSWNSYWGDEGYIKMARNRDNNCGIATYASYPLI